MPYRWTLTDLTAPYLGSEVLTKDPIGWDNGTYTIKRSEMYKGAFHEYTTELKFHCNGGGKEYIDSVYQSEDIDGRIYVLVEYDCDGSGTYDELFTGIINLASYKTDGEYVTVNIEKSDLLTKLMNRDEVGVNLETITSIGGNTITAPATTTLTLPPVSILFENEWVIEDGYYHEDTRVIGSGAFETWVTPSMGISKGDMDTVYPGVETNDDSSFAFFEGLLYTNPLLTVRETGVNYPITVNYDLSIIGTFADDETTGGGFRDNQSVQLKLIYGHIDIENTSSITDAVAWNIGTYTVDNYTTPFNIVATGSFQLQQGDSVWLVWQYYNVASGTYTTHYSWDYDRSYLRLNSRTTYDATEAKTMLVHEAFNQVVDSIADYDNNFKSDFYGRTDSDKRTYVSDGCGSQIAITNGLNIRIFPNKPIHCSFKELFETFDSLHSIGMGIVDGLVRIEPMTYWFDSATKIITLPLVNKYEVKNDNRRYINKIEIGYQKWESEFKGGLDEPCSKHEYSTKINSTKNTYNKLSKFIASSYAIELTRRKNINVLPSEDWRYDNDNFLICTTRDAYAGLVVDTYGYNFSEGANMQALASAYNFRITPARMLLAHMNIITAGLQLIQGVIRFVKGEGNLLFRVKQDTNSCPENYNNQALQENQNLNWNDSNVANISPLWSTETYSFEYPLSYTEFKTIKANPYGYVEFYKFSGESMYGYIMNMEYKMKTGMTKFELLKKA